MSTSCARRSGSCDDTLLLERGEPLAARLDRGAAAGDRRLRIVHAGFLQLALDFELAQVAEQRARLSRETIGLRFERADPIGHAPRFGFRAAAIRRLRREARGQRQRNNARRQNGESWFGRVREL